MRTRNNRKGPHIEVTSFGLDMGAFGTAEKTQLARADRVGNYVYVTLFKNHPLNQKLPANKRIEIIRNKSNDFFRLLRHFSRRIFVDVPIDLQSLPHIPGTIKRPVDSALDGQSPLSRDIGSHVARFSFLFNNAFGQDCYEKALGTTVYETYPKASLKRIGLNYEKYKTTGKERSFIRSISSNKWCNELIHNNVYSNNLLDNALKLKLQADTSQLRITDDQFDAIICALTGVLVPINGFNELELNQILSEFPISQSYSLPKGYVIMGKHQRETIRRSIKSIIVREEEQWKDEFVSDPMSMVIQRFRTRRLIMFT